jgi:hypothetical protein
VSHKLGNDQIGWGFNGVHGEALIQIGGGWVKGRMALQIMFYPSQVQSTSGNDTTEQKPQATQAIFVQYGEIKVP